MSAVSKLIAPAFLACLAGYVGYTQYAKRASDTGNPRVLVAGGAGYIASHTIVCLLNQGYDVTVVDNFVNSNVESLNRVRKITGCAPGRLVIFECDMCDKVRIYIMRVCLSLVPPLLLPG